MHITDDHDAFVDYCDENGLDPEVEDFYAWREEQIDRAEDAAAERAIDYMREREMDFDDRF